MLFQKEYIFLLSGVFVLNRKYSWKYMILHSIHHNKVLISPLISFGLLLLLLFHSLLMLLLLILPPSTEKQREIWIFLTMLNTKINKGTISSGLISTKKEILLNCYWNKHECIVFTVKFIAFRHTVHIIESHLFNGEL